MDIVGIDESLLGNDGNLLDIDIKDLVVPFSMVACYVALIVVFFVVSHFYPFLKDKKEKVKNIALLISFMSIPVILIIVNEVM